MEHIKKKNSVQGFCSKECSVIEYHSINESINACIATLQGRYPESGFAYNEESTELGFCMKGSGKLVTKSQTAEIQEGDVVIIPANERYYWEGNMTILLPCSPSWRAEQHKNEADLQ
jgi:mannose-6-phosphate isomerase-like protein (cupin superfamily)